MIGESYMREIYERDRGLKRAPWCIVRTRSSRALAQYAKCSESIAGTAGTGHC